MYQLMLEGCNMRLEPRWLAFAGCVDSCVDGLLCDHYDLHPGLHVTYGSAALIAPHTLNVSYDVYEYHLLLLV